MRIQIQPKTFIVSALSGNESVGFSVHPATNILVAKTQISIDDMQGVAAIRPYLKLAMTGGTEDVITVVRFQYWKDGRVIYPLRPDQSPPMDRRFWGTSVFQPGDVLDMRPYQRGDRLVGEWNVTADIAFFARRLFQTFLPKSFNAVKSGLRFQRLVGFKFEVVSNETSIELTSTGRLTVDRDQVNTTYTLNDL